MSDPVLAAPPRHQTRLSPLKLLRTIKDSSIASFAEPAFKEEVVERRFLWRRHVIVNSPEAVKRILLDNVENYVKSDLLRHLLEPGLGKGLITSSGELWRSHRRIMAPAFDPRSLAAYAPPMIEEAEGMLARWDELPAGATVDVATEMMRLTLAIIARAMFSTSDPQLLDTVERGMATYQEVVRPGLFDLLGLPSWIPRRGAAAGRRALTGVDDLIAQLMARGKDTPDLLGRLLSATDPVTGQPLSPREVRDEVVTIFAAGHETTAQALTWTWYLLSQHPGAVEELEAELDRVLAGRPPSYEDIPQLAFARMVIEESMRLYPPAHTMSRIAVADDDLPLSEGSYRVSRGTLVLIVPWLLHRHERLWNRPDRFRPERFAASAATKRHRFAYIPFGGGPRICIGAGFAMTEAILILASIAQRYRLRPSPGHVVEPVGLITLRPRNGLKLVLERR